MIVGCFKFAVLGFVCMMIGATTAENLRSTHVKGKIEYIELTDYMNITELMLSQGQVRARDLELTLGGTPNPTPAPTQTPAPSPASSVPGPAAGPCRTCYDPMYYGLQEMTCNAGGTPQQVMTILGVQVGSCWNMDPCLCGLMPIQMAYWCPLQCRPSCGGTCGRDMQCPEGHNVLPRGENNEIRHFHVDWEELPQNFNAWPINMGCPLCC